MKPIDETYCCTLGFASNHIQDYTASKKVHAFLSIKSWSVWLETTWSSSDTFGRDWILVSKSKI